MGALVDRITDDGFLAYIEVFVEENAQYFVNDDEHRHYYHDIHRKYKRFFESRVEAWLREKGASSAGFLEAVERGGLAEDVAEELLAVADYQAFVVMMKRQRELLLEETSADVAYPPPPPPPPPLPPPG